MLSFRAVALLLVLIVCISSVSSTKSSKKLNKNILFKSGFDSYNPPFQTGVPYSAVLQGKIWSIQEGCNGGVACATLVNSNLQSGWYLLDIVSSASFSDYDQAFGAGYIEAALTQELIWFAWQSFFNGTNLTLSAAFSDFILENDKWVRSQAVAQSNSNYWSQVGLTLAQFDGLYAGYVEYAPPEQFLGYEAFLTYQLQNELGDIAATVGDSDVPKYHPGEHCSVLVRLSDNGQELHASHVTWDTFNSMLRIYKHYDFPFSSAPVTGVSFSSYPGCLPSGDDFYITTSNLVIMETTNEIFNRSLYTNYTTIHTVPYWIRVLVANRVALNGQTWSDIFAMYNSGTYNNQWQVVDYKQFTPGATPANGTLWILEQVPGFVVAQDQTDYLISNGYWGSYNIPYYPFIYDISGYYPYYEKFGNSFSWSECARAQIFRRDVGGVQTIDDMKRIMRYNQYQTDPLSLQDACKGISARCDLNPPWVNRSLNVYDAFGATDAKITTNTMAPSRVAVVVAGPTWDAQPPFAWTKQWTPSNVVPGQPTVFAFDWISTVPQQP